jgi:hypothetical protein
MVWPASGEMVACRSNRWPGRNRAMMGGLGSLALNKALGGVKRVTLGRGVSELKARHGRDRKRERGDALASM